MAKFINNIWQKEIIKRVENGGEVNEIISFSKAAQWLIWFLCDRNIPFRVYNMGAGVKRITSQTEICPCCKKKL